MGLPSVGSYEAVSILQNKGKFRRFLSENGFNVPVAKSFKSIEEALKSVVIFNWPVIVKPTDSAGSKGVTRVDDERDLKKSIENALRYSHCDEFIIEDYLEQKGYSSDSDSFSTDGKMVFFSFSSQRFDPKAENPYTPSAYSWPSSISERHQSELKNEIQRLISLLGLKSSIYNIETRESINGKSYIMELSPRGGGNRLAEMMKYLTGVDMISNAVKAALGMQLDDIKQEPMRFNLAEVILHSEVSGVYDHLWINENIRNNVIEEDIWINGGTAVGGFKGANEAIGTLVLKFETADQLETVMHDLDEYIKVILK
jgi:biotin carboxylase